MRKLYFSVLSFLAFYSAQSQLSFRSIHFNPPGGLGVYEYVEITGTPNTLIGADVYLITIDGDAAENPGRIDNVEALTGYGFSDNGILLLTASIFTPDPLYDPETNTQTLNFAPDLENGTNTYAIVVATVTPTIGTDLDANDDGVIDIGTLPWQSVEDAVSINDVGAGDFGYAVNLHATLGTDIAVASDGAVAEAVAFMDGRWLGVNISPTSTNPGRYVVLHAWDENGDYVPYYDSWILTPGSILGSLPVILRSFYVSHVNNQVNISWKTEQEINSAYFDVERSIDGKHFNAIGRVNAAGSSTIARSYSLTDNNVSGKGVYYRLRVVDLDAHFEYSRIVKVNLGSGMINVNNIYPSPAKDQVTIEWNSREKILTRIVVRDLMGRQVINRTLNSVQGFNQATLPVRSLQSGSYILQLVTTEGVLTGKFVKF